MSVTWTDLPGSMLANRSDAIDFIATGDVVAISVSFGPYQPEERVYRDDSFLFPYLESERAADRFALRRTGGWPSNPTVYVDECVAEEAAVVDGSGNRIIDGSGNRVLP